jgi:hypothetical protein
MQWLTLLTLAIAFASIPRHLKTLDEVFALALYCTGILSALWGFIVAPTLAQIMLGALAFGWLQVSSLRA